MGKFRLVLGPADSTLQGTMADNPNVGRGSDNFTKGVQQETPEKTIPKTIPLASLSWMNVGFARCRARRPEEHKTKARPKVR